MVTPPFSQILYENGVQFVVEINRLQVRVIEILSKKLRLGASARIAVLGVGAVCSRVQKETGYLIRFLHEPDPDDPPTAESTTPLPMK